MYEALNCGNVDVPRLRQVLAGLPMPQAADGRLVLAVDVSNWLRPDAPTSVDRLFCHVYGRSGRSSDQFIPGWPYSFVAALESGRTSWCQLLDAVRLGPEDDVAEVTAAQLRRVVEDLIELGRWHAGDRNILIVFDAGYDAPRMAHLLTGLPVEVLGRMRSDRVMRRPTPTLKEYALAYPQGGRPPKHGKEFRFAELDTWGEPDAATTQVTDRYGTTHAMAWDRIHPRLTTRSAWIDHTGELPVIEGTLIRLQVDRLPGGGDPLPLWLWFVRHRPGQRGRRRALAGVSTQVRHRAPLQADETDPRLDPSEAANPRGRRALDLADHRRAHPDPPPARGNRRPAAAVGEVRRARPAHPGPSPPGISEPPPAPALPCSCTKTLNTRPGTATWLEEPAARHPLRRGQDRETTREHHRTKPTHTIKNKVSTCLRSGSTVLWPD
ncbi:DDE superfamily endonuclease [Streptomyces sp. TLI_185]|nr:DDE superfamily endonuclease [Streptomyces sp. TLI_185]